MSDLAGIAQPSQAPAWEVSRFMHGEQGAPICTSKIIPQVGP